MRSSILAAAFLASLGAQAKDSTSTTVAIFSPTWDNNLPGITSFAASVAGINAKATTYHVGCADGVAKSDCDIATSWTITQGPETVNFAAQYIATSSGSDGYDVTITETYDCSFKSWSESASCTMSASMGGTVRGGSTASSSSSKATTSVATSSYYELDVTGGVKSFTAPAATETPGAAAAGPAGAFITAAPVVAAAIAALL
ncbi:hypothetical protein LT330_000551 [Penicillium expansum]|uniref:Uncharacterized protein n=1 Tax=Penicillium expansum TaxID=27334 RepID=A0A0A2JVH3_PENEN|nr:hypothetical protein PEX2_077670 [Penicillium expansum]KAK4871314.1 hypothetical protein LT330_000551 [Penicillium expansum]KGO42118.1 hypothetical protein PEXP_050680 [Penicillium expansum]KGO56160.1 hypothetical protein PEX2_077670 [Penicillium expansum]KGO71421.1 hypothetical protein PEX1_067590 [Penicillium expansum]